MIKNNSIILHKNKASYVPNTIDKQQNIVKKFREVDKYEFCCQKT